MTRRFAHHATLFLALLIAGAAFAADTPPDVSLKNAAVGVTQLIAHRGASAERPECTLSSLRRAIEVGATAVEVDVRTSGDGRLFILHDSTLDRTTDGKGPANKLSLAELQRLDAGSWFSPKFKGERIPSLIEAAQACRGKIDLLLDLKEQGDEYDRKVVGIIQKNGDPKRTIVGVRSVAQAKRFRELLPEAKQLALIPSVETIEDFAKAGSEVIRIWPRWLEKDDTPVQHVRATGKGLHLNGTVGGLEETLQLLAHCPDSMSSDDPRRLKATLKRIANGEFPRKKLSQLVSEAAGIRVETGESGVGNRTFLNRDYRMLQLPAELGSMPRYVFDGGSGHRLSLTFRQSAVVFAAFEYNDTGNWSFPDDRSPKDAGWHLWRADSYRGSSNPGKEKPHFASLWFREFEAGQTLSGLPPWWVCVAVIDLKTARGIKGFREGLVTATPPVIHRFAYDQVLAKTRPLHVPEFESAGSFPRWQMNQRQLFHKRMLFPYRDEIHVVRGKVTAKASYRQEEFLVETDGERLFRFFRLTPDGAASNTPRPTLVCFMGHGKVKQILEDEDSYQHACAARFAKTGYLVFAMENVGMEPGPDTHHDLDRILRLEGQGWYSLLFAHQRILLDHVFADPGVDTKRVAVTGVSTGGLLALSAAAMEPRVTAASVQGIFGSMRVSFIQDRNHHCGCGAIPGLLPEFDLPELALLVAPRPLHISNGETDGFSPQEARRCVELISPLYRKAGGAAPTMTVSPGGHAFAFEPALKFFQENLK